MNWASLARVFGSRDFMKIGRSIGSLTKGGTKFPSKLGWRNLGRQSARYFGAGRYAGRGWTRAGFSAARIGGGLTAASIGLGAVNIGARAATYPYRLLARSFGGGSMRSNQPIIRI